MALVEGFATHGNFGDVVAKLHAQSTLTFFLGMVMGIPATFVFFFFFFFFFLFLYNLFFYFFSFFLFLSSLCFLPFLFLPSFPSPFSPV